MTLGVTAEARRGVVEDILGWFADRRSEHDEARHPR